MHPSNRIKFLIDVGVGKKVEESLLKNGYNIKAVRDIDPGMADDSILRMAVSENRMVITMDKDFGELIFNSGLPHSGVLLLRLEDARANEKINVLEKILEDHSEKLSNNFCVYQNSKLRVRKKDKDIGNEQD
ncbi:DUF5615 family PIN-like protein [bacterium]|nr:DUF5615 family PIN-like protein [bacterium]